MGAVTGYPFADAVSLGVDDGCSGLRGVGGAGEGSADIAGPGFGCFAGVAEGDLVAVAEGVGDE